MPAEQRQPDRNKMTKVRVTRTTRTKDSTFFKGEVETDEVTAKALRKEMRKTKSVRPYIEDRVQEQAAPEPDDVEEPDEPQGGKASEHL